MADRHPALDLLAQRNSAPKLADPAPDDRQLDTMLRCALRSPDHARLRPSRFLSFRGDERHALGEMLEASLLRGNPQADAAAVAKARQAPLRAPLVVVVMAAVQEHPKVPAWEQRMSAGCAAFSLELAAEALGFHSIWRTGSYTEDPQLVRALGGAAQESIVAFLYIGTRDCTPKPVPELDPSEFHDSWSDRLLRLSNNE